MEFKFLSIINTYIFYVRIQFEEIIHDTLNKWPRYIKGYVSYKCSLKIYSKSVILRIFYDDDIKVIFISKGL